MDGQELRVDIVSDVVCPWCAIGYHQLKTASEATGIGIDVHWHPFELNPQMVEEGEDLRDHIAAKYGTRRVESDKARARLTALGAALGFEFNYTDTSRMWNTFRAHQLIDWAGAQGKTHDAVMALFAAYFTRGEAISDPNVLVKNAREIGLDGAAALEMLESGALADTVRQKEHFWTSRGVTGVPAMIFAKRHLVTGAQGEETYARILDHVSREAA